MVELAAIGVDNTIESRQYIAHHWTTPLTAAMRTRILTAASTILSAGAISAAMPMAA